MKATSCETHHRSLAKSASYRAASIVLDAAAAYLLTRDVAVSATIVVFVELYSTLLYYLHERVWAHINFGRCPPDAGQDTVYGARTF